MAGTRTAPGAVVRHQVEAVQGRAEARVVPGALVLRLAGAAATRGRIVARPVVPGRVEPRPAEAAMVLVVVIVVQEKAVPTADLAAVAAPRALAVAYPAGAAMDPVAAAALEMVEAMVAGAAARPGRIVVPWAVVPAAAREGAARVPAGVVVATVPVAVAADPGKVVPMTAPVAVVPLLAVPVVPALAGAAARPGVTRMELVVATPAAVAVQIGPYLVEEVAGALCARQRPEAQACLVKKAVAVQFAPLEAFLLPAKRQEEVFGPHLNYLEQRHRAWC